jgi:hypothetical protein
MGMTDSKQATHRIVFRSADGVETTVVNSDADFAADVEDRNRRLAEYGLKGDYFAQEITAELAAA